jgi:catechol 2,3-dioxygenase-like lactoylglutathione lyase family enzyme
MDLRSFTSVLFVKDIRVSKNFYSNVLNLTIEFDFGANIMYKNGPSIWEMQKNHIIPSKLDEKKIMDPSVNRFELYFDTDHIEDIQDKLKHHKISFLHEIHEESWGQKTIRFFDPDHHLIEIGESMTTFLTRFHKQGLTFEQISEKTGVSIDVMKRILSE